MAGLHTKPIEGLTELDIESSSHLQPKPVTGRAIDTNKRALDVVPLGYFYLNPLLPNIIVVSGDTSTIGVTAHGAKIGDLVRFVTTVNNVGMYENYIESIIDSNNFKLISPLAATITAGDTINILRGVSPRYSSDGATLASLTPDAIKIMKDGVITNVAKDTVVAANTVPVPVEIVAAAGSPINITAGDLNVQLSHATANFDSTRIGDGTDLLAINADGSITSVVTATDLDIRDLTHVSDSVRIGDGTDIMLVNADGSITSVVTATNLDIRDLSHTQDSVRIGDGTDIMLVNADGSINSLVTATDLDIRNLVHATDSVRIGDGTDLVQVTAAGRMLVEAIVTDGTDTMSVNPDGSINAVVVAANLDIRDLTHVSDSVRIGDGTDLLLITAAGQAEVRAAQLPTALGQVAMASSLSVTIATDQTAIPMKDGVALGAPSIGTNATIGDGAVVTVAAPANAYELVVQADINNTHVLRMGFLGGLPTTTTGYMLNPGESVGPLKVGVDLKLIGQAGAASQSANYIWTVRA